MLKIVLLFISIILCTGCDTNLPDKSTPAGAFSRLAPCINEASTECLFRELDNETRWTVSSIFKILKETRQTVENSYPEDNALRNSVYGKWQQEATAQTDVEMFDQLCRKHDCLKKLAMGFGAVKSNKINGDTATITTVRDKTFILHKSKKHWGIVLLSDVLEGEKTRLSDSLQQVKRNAQEYEQQRLATGQQRLAPEKKQ